MCHDKAKQVTVDLGELKNTCFVAMPFDRLYTAEYETVIRPAIEKANLVAIRGDEIYAKARIVDDIWHSIRSARAIVAELTSKNPNVLYEVGLAHAIGKAVIIITREEDDVPFDLKSLRYIYYDTNDPYWGTSLAAALQNMLENVLRVKDVSSHLEGIAAVQPPAFPSVIPVPQTKQKEEEQVLAVAGQWKCSISEDCDYDLRLSLSQNKKELSGIATVGYFVDEVPSVVQEVLIGGVDGRKVSLACVNYTFVVRGKDSTYSMDSYQLELSEDGRKLIGTGKDGRRIYKVAFNREDDGASEMHVGSRVGRKATKPSDRTR
ncbi:MAG: hypothetical protein HY879_12585 [Deltaproteobacteria bacterium]|nr:hypothetical protein [Deltaproteobacteria bacterium]